MEMGRQKTAFPDLPARMTARKMKSGKVLYYHAKAGKKTPLGDDLRAALHLYADLDNPVPVGGASFLAISDAWESGVPGQTPPIAIGRRGKPRSKGTITTYTCALVHLRKFFGKNKLDTIEPVHVRQYLDKRTKRGAANTEVAVLGLIWNWARSTGRTNKANPCTGIDRNYLPPRSRYVHNDEYAGIYAKCEFWVQDALDLLLLTYQRPGDIVRARITDISDGYLWFKQGKTGKRLGFALEGELAEVIERCRGRERKAGALTLVADENGQPVSLKRLRSHFKKAGGNPDWQLRDLRAKAITDTGNILDASERAAHSDVAMTRRVYDRTRGRKVRPLR